MTLIILYTFVTQNLQRLTSRSQDNSERQVEWVAAERQLRESQLHQLQSVLNTTTRLIHRPSQYEHVTLMVRDLHWLRSVIASISSRLCSLTDACTVWRNGIFLTTSHASPSIRCARPHGLELIARWPLRTAGLWVL